MIETGIVVDTTMPNSITPEAFQKCRADKDLRNSASPTIVGRFVSSARYKGFMSLRERGNIEQAHAVEEQS